MLTKRPLIILCLVLLIAFATNLIIDQEAKDDVATTIGKNDPDLYMLNANITQYNKQGKKQHHILAERVTHFPLTDITTLKAPDMTLFPSLENDTPWDISAQHGRSLPKVQVREEIFELWDQVLAIQTTKDGNTIRIKTNSLTVYPERGYAETDQKVSIDDKLGRTTAAGMKAYFEAGKFNLLSSDKERVQTILQPAFKNKMSKPPHTKKVL